AEVDPLLFSVDKVANSRDAVIEALLPYIRAQLSRGARMNHITRHILGLYQGVPGARKFRRHISENAYRKEAGIEVLEEAYKLVKQSRGQLVPNPRMESIIR
ncbi:MAG: tRNA-dihydrouridine synthase, partial [Proteobacteria bacterium]|nr:tRNA-dihydrouridine synthase [Pseudomonadota bacterium]